MENGTQDTLTVAGAAFDPPAEATDGYLELLARSGRIRRRLRVGTQSLRVGRGYDNDLIMDDLYVCPSHAELRLGEGGLQVRDLGSLNGIVDARGWRHHDEIVVASGQMFQLGRTRLRFRSTRFPVAPTKRDSDASRLRRLFERLGFLALLALGTVMLFVWLMILGSATEVGADDLARQVALFVAAVLVWTAIWSGCSRLTQHRWSFFTHCGVACAGFCASTICEAALAYAAFAFQLGTWWGVVTTLAAVPVMALPLYGHLRLTSGAARRRLAVIATLTAGGLLGLIVFFQQGEEAEFSAVPELSVPLKPPYVLVVKGASPAEFFQRSGVLGERIAAEQPPIRGR